MRSDRVDAESKVSGNQANIPARIRSELDIDDGDQLRWNLTSEGAVRVEVVSRETRTFEDFEGFDGDAETNAVDDHDGWGVE